MRFVHPWFTAGDETGERQTNLQYHSTAGFTYARPLSPSTPESSARISILRCGVVALFESGHFRWRVKSEFTLPDFEKIRDFRDFKNRTVPFAGEP